MQKALSPSLIDAEQRGVPQQRTGHAKQKWPQWPQSPDDNSTALLLARALETVKIEPRTL